MLSFCHLLLAIEAADANAGTMAGAYSRSSGVIAGYGGSKGQCTRHENAERVTRSSRHNRARSKYSGHRFERVPGLCLLLLLIRLTILIGCLARCPLECLCKFDWNEKTELCAVSTNDFFQKLWQEVATFSFRPKQEELVLHQSVTVPVVAIQTSDEIDRAPDPLLA